ncbi:hypothetical protein JCM15519_04330 [Fundidesulfovibrio butyratiphilus]
MKIKLLHAVLHNAKTLAPGALVDLAEPAAKALIDSGAAVAVEEPAPAAPTALDDTKPAADPKTAEAETKAAKAKEGK